MDEGLSVRGAEDLARKAQGGAATAPRKAGRGDVSRDADTQALEVDLSQALGLSVEILDRNGVGEVRIRYQTLEQLDDLCRRLSGG